MFRDELEALINKYNMENRSDTPDFILARFLSRCLTAFDDAVNQRKLWYSRPPDARQGHEPDADACRWTAEK